MIFFVLILAMVIISGMTVAKSNEFFADYCSPKNTATINAIFSVLIFLSHASQYLQLDGTFDEPYLALRKFLGQLVVITYLFFSGYGIMESISRKGTAYVKQMPINRLFKTWLHFAVAIGMFLIVQMGLFQKDYSVKQILLSFTGAMSVGNSNWYMFVTFGLYIIVILSFLLFRKSKVAGVICVCVLSFGFLVFEGYLAEIQFAGFAKHYYNTLLCFPLGMVFSLIKPYIDKVFMKNDLLWFGGFTALVVAFIYFSQNRTQRFAYYEMFVFTAVAMILMFMMKVNIKSTILDWFGKHIFSFFILQRLPMLVLSQYGFANNTAFFIITCFFATILLSVVFDYAMDMLDKLLFNRKKASKQLAK